MPPQATGFRYTPQGYLQSTSSRAEQRPWNSTEEDREEEAVVVKQEERPSRKHAAREAQSRIQRRKDLYRGILKGEMSPVEDSSAEDPLDYALQVLDENSHSDDSGEHSPSSSSLKAQQAREARYRRISGQSSQPIMSATRTDSEAVRVRNLRAQRLRAAKSVSKEEEDFSEVLQQRRAAEIERERELRAKERAERNQARVAREREQRETQANAEQRRECEAAKRKAARDALARRLREESRQVRRSREEYDDSIPEMTLFEEVQSMVRDSGLLKTCVTSCFGEDDGVGEFDESITRVYNERLKTSIPTRAKHSLEPSVLSEEKTQEDVLLKPQHVL